MSFLRLSSVLALSAAAFAFSDSSPWVLLSTSAIPPSQNAHQLQTSAEVMAFTRDFLTQCPTDRYLIVTQPGVNAADLGQRDNCAMPHLCRAVADPRIKGKYTVAEVIGDVSSASIEEHIRSSCVSKGKTAAKVLRASFDSPTAHRAQALARNDAALVQDLDVTTSGDSYTILFYATPQEPNYDSEFVEPLHLDLKRSSNHLTERANDTERDTRPLFEKYQFFTPGIFMGIIVAVVLFSILGTGIKALASLRVSYGAFDKEMGPAAQKKTQ